MLSFFAGCLLAACEEEAIVHPPPPPATPVRELGNTTPIADATSQPAKPAGPAAPTGATARPTQKMTLEDFMEDVIEPQTRKAVKSKKQDPALDALLKQLGTLMPEELAAGATGPKKTWQAIVDATFAAPGVPKYGASCKQCHALWKKPYKKTFHKREVDVVVTSE